MSADRLLTVKEYAALFRKHEQTVYRRIRLGTFTRFPLERDGAGTGILIRVPSDLVQRLTGQHGPPSA